MKRKVEISSCFGALHNGSQAHHIRITVESIDNSHGARLDLRGHISTLLDVNGGAHVHIVPAQCMRTASNPHGKEDTENTELLYESLDRIK